MEVIPSSIPFNDDVIELVQQSSIAGTSAENPISLSEDDGEVASGASSKRPADCMDGDDDDAGAKRFKVIIESIIQPAPAPAPAPVPQVCYSHYYHYFLFFIFY